MRMYEHKFKKKKLKAFYFTSRKISGLFAIIFLLVWDLNLLLKKARQQEVLHLCLKLYIKLITGLAFILWLSCDVSMVQKIVLIIFSIT